MRRFVTTEDIRELAEVGEFELMMREGTVLTDAALDEAHRLGVRLWRGPAWPLPGQLRLIGLLLAGSPGFRLRPASPRRRSHHGTPRRLRRGRPTPPGPASRDFRTPPACTRSS